MSLYHVLKSAILAVIGGLIYILIELIWRGHSHISMFVLDGVCFVAIGLINELFPWELGIVWQSMIGAVLVTALEFITGLIVNIWLGLGVWDYSDVPLNIMGQICLPFSLAWMGLSAVAIILDDYLRHWMFGEEKPHYKPVLIFCCIYENSGSTAINRLPLYIFAHKIMDL